MTIESCEDRQEQLGEIAVKKGTETTIIMLFAPKNENRRYSSSLFSAKMCTFVAQNCHGAKALDGKRNC